MEMKKHQQKLKERKERMDKSREVKTSMIKKSTPEYILQREKHESYSSMVMERASADEDSMREKIHYIEQENERRKQLLQMTLEARLGKVTAVLSKIDDNRKKAAVDYKKHVNEVVNKFVHKQMDTEKQRIQAQKTMQANIEKKKKKFEEALKNAHDEKEKIEKQKADEIIQQQKKDSKKLKAIRVKKRKELTLLHAKAEERNQKIHEKLMVHEDIMAEFREEGDMLLQQINERAERIQKKKEAEAKMVEDRKLIYVNTGND